MKTNTENPPPCSQTVPANSVRQWTLPVPLTSYRFFRARPKFAGGFTSPIRAQSPISPFRNHRESGLIMQKKPLSFRGDSQHHSNKQSLQLCNTTVFVLILHNTNSIFLCTTLYRDKKTRIVSFHHFKKLWYSTNKSCFRRITNWYFVHFLIHIRINRQIQQKKLSHMLFLRNYDII